MTKSRFTPHRRAGIAAALATALALTSVTATPARAGTEDQFGAIAAASFFALVTAGIIASTVNRDRAPEQGAGYRPPRGDGGRPGGHGPGRPYVDPRKALPSQCDFTVQHGRDRGTYYDARCLQREFNHWPFLPDRCEERIEVRHGHDIRAYDAQCLARYGYSEAKGPRAAYR